MKYIIHSPTKAEIAAQAARDAVDHSWHRCHDFQKGWFWLRPSDAAKVYMDDLSGASITYAAWPNAEPVAREALLVKILEKRRVRLEALRAYYKVHPLRFDDITLPVIKGGFPTTSIRDAVSGP